MATSIVVAKFYVILGIAANHESKLQNVNMKETSGCVQGELILNSILVSEFITTTSLIAKVNSIELTS